MKVLFMSNIPSPYRLDFFNEFGKYCELTVSFEGKKATDRDEKWVGDNNIYYTAIYLKGKRTKSDQFFCPGIISLIKQKYNYIIVGNYSSMTSMYAIEYMRIHKIPFLIEADGGLVSKESNFKYKIKRHFISSATAWLSSGNATTEYFLHYGAKKEKVYNYPFTSLREEDILKKTPTVEEKNAAKKKLGMRETEKIVLSVGRFSYMNGYGKGFDILMKAMKRCSSKYALYIVGDTPTQEFVDMKKKMGLDNVHFIEFKTKQELKDYYLAADLLCLQTRGDVWGLVINEGMAMGLPIITTDCCVAGLELVEIGKNGYIVSVEDEIELSDKINLILSDDLLRSKFAENSLNKIQQYTIENMAKRHIVCLSIS